MMDANLQQGEKAGAPPSAAPAQSQTCPPPNPAAPPALSAPEGNQKAQPPTSTPDPVPRGPSTSQSPSTSRSGLYVPQFSTATQMILKRMKSEAASLASGLSPGKGPLPALPALPALPEIKSGFNTSAYDDAKRRVMMGMNTSTSMTLAMPAPPRPTPPPPPPTAQPYLPPPPVQYQPHTTAASRPKMASGAAGLSAIRRVTLGLTASGRPITQKPPQPSTTGAAQSKEKQVRPVPRTKAGTKRKRGATKGSEDDSSSVSSLSDISDNEDATSAQPATPSAPPILTKSGRHVQKPVTYKPAEMESSSAKKRVHYSKVRTAEQALCKKCTRMHSPASNQMVFCDGCNEGWHQMCHDPWIDDAVVRDTKTAWFCAACQAKRDRHYSNTASHNHVPKRHKVTAPARESWADRTPQQKKAYLSTLSSQELVGLLMSSLEIHPDLPIFPGSGEPATAPSTPGTPQTPSDLPGSSRKGGGKGPKNAKVATAPPQQQQPQNTDDKEFDPLEPPWPKPGHGLYALLPPEDEDDCLGDANDYEAFSVIVYDEKGRKIEENGIKVVRTAA